MYPYLIKPKKYILNQCSVFILQNLLFGNMWTQQIFVFTVFMSDTLFLILLGCGTDMLATV